MTHLRTRNEIHRVCNRCGVGYPITTEHFFADKNGRDGLRPQCKSCQKQQRQTDRGRALDSKSSALYRKRHPGYTKQQNQRYYRTLGGYLRCVFGNMKRRCNDPSAKDFGRYGGRGIKLCFTSDEFVDYVVNELQVDPRGLEIDRIDNDGSYEKGNIRFVTRSENCKNRRRK